MEQVKATMLNVIYRTPEKDWLVAKVKKDDTNEIFTATGPLPYSEDGEPLQLYGEWVEDKKYGKQFKVSSTHRLLPTSVSGLRSYLAHSEDIKGIGPVRARKLADFFGDNLLSILDKSPQRLSECPGISVEQARRIAGSWKQDSAVRQLSLYLGENNISPRWAGRILKHWDPGTAVDNLQKNPYALTAVEGIGFITADEIALNLGGKKDSPERIAAACVYVVSQAVQEGNTFLHEQQLINAIVKLVSPRGKDTTRVQEQALQAVTNAVANKELSCQEISDGLTTARLLYLPYLYKAEKGLAERIAELNEYHHPIPEKLQSALTYVQEKQHVKFSDKQMDAIRGAFSNHTLVITGGPGTGKTTCTKSICDIADKVGKHVLLCAPTGRAAKRLSEITGRSASTIHRMLGWRDDGPVHNRQSPIDANVLIVDEASMLDLDLAYKLFQAVPDSCSVILIGDVDQLPAVGAGATLRDIISSKTVPTVTLDTVFRQAEQSLIIRNAHFIRKGEMPRFPETKGVKENSYVMWIPPAAKGTEGGRDDAEWLKSTLSSLVTKHIPDKFKQGSKPIDPIKDIQVLVPMKKHTMGTYELNKVLQKALNPNGEEFTVKGKIFRVGDRVTQTRNNYDEGMEVYNGDIGFITEHRQEDKQVVVDFYGRPVTYEYADTDNLYLAYAQTIHKSQGSEYPIVIVVMAYQHWPMLERNLIYTANTRAKDLCLFLASRGAIERAVKNCPVHERNTYLSQRLRSYMNKEAHA